VKIKKEVYLLFIFILLVYPLPHKKHMVRDYMFSRIFLGFFVSEKCLKRMEEDKILDMILKIILEIKINKDGYLSFLQIINLFNNIICHYLYIPFYYR